MSGETSPQAYQGRPSSHHAPNGRSRGTEHDASPTASSSRVPSGHLSSSASASISPSQSSQWFGALSATIHSLDTEQVPQLRAQIEAIERRLARHTEQSLPEQYEHLSTLLSHLVKSHGELQTRANEAEATAKKASAQCTTSSEHLVILQRQITLLESQHTASSAQTRSTDDDYSKLSRRIDELTQDKWSLTRSVVEHTDGIRSALTASTAALREVTARRAEDAARIAHLESALADLQATVRDMSGESSRRNEQIRTLAEQHNVAGTIPGSQDLGQSGDLRDVDEVHSPFTTSTQSVEARSRVAVSSAFGAVALGASSTRQEPMRPTAVPTMLGRVGGDDVESLFETISPSEISFSMPYLAQDNEAMHSTATAPLAREQRALNMTAPSDFPATVAVVPSGANQTASTGGNGLILPLGPPVDAAFPCRAGEHKPDPVQQHRRLSFEGDGQSRRCGSPVEIHRIKQEGAETTEPELLVLSPQMHQFLLEVGQENRNQVAAPASAVASPVRHALEDAHTVDTGAPQYSPANPRNSDSGQVNQVKRPSAAGDRSDRGRFLSEAASVTNTGQDLMPQPHAAQLSASAHYREFRVYPAYLAQAHFRSTKHPLEDIFVCTDQSSSISMMSRRDYDRLKIQLGFLSLRELREGDALRGEGLVTIDVIWPGRKAENTFEFFNSQEQSSYTTKAVTFRVTQLLEEGSFTATITPSLNRSISIRTTHTCSSREIQGRGSPWPKREHPSNFLSSSSPRREFHMIKSTAAGRLSPSLSSSRQLRLPAMLENILHRASAEKGARRPSLRLP